MVKSNRKQVRHWVHPANLGSLRWMRAVCAGLPQRRTSYARPKGHHRPAGVLRLCGSMRDDSPRGANQFWFEIADIGAINAPRQDEEPAQAHDRRASSLPRSILTRSS